MPKYHRNAPRSFSFVISTIGGKDDGEICWILEPSRHVHISISSLGYKNVLPIDIVSFSAYTYVRTFVSPTTNFSLSLCIRTRIYLYLYPYAYIYTNILYEISLILVFLLLLLLIRCNHTTVVQPKPPLFVPFLDCPFLAHSVYHTLTLYTTPFLCSNKFNVFLHIDSSSHSLRFPYEIFLLDARDDKRTNESPLFRPIFSFLFLFFFQILPRMREDMRWKYLKNF